MDIEAVKRRYTETVTKVDALGRAIKVGRIRPAQQLRAAEFGATDSVSNTIRLVCMVRGIDGDDFAFPASRAEVNSRLDKLDEEGLAAVGEALAELFGAASDDTPDKTLGEAAKN